MLITMITTRIITITIIIIIISMIPAQDARAGQGRPRAGPR